ncbi:MAG: hypothetical protein IKP02_07535 [Paludibacteraceae bacterium]|nr:hypothetical protein [Paludibacteraceae bacterium]
MKNQIRLLWVTLALVAFAACSDDNSIGPHNYTVGSFTDERDGETYRTVEIGNQEWMTENLRYNAKGSVCFDYGNANCKIYGRLYRWSIAMDSSETVPCGDGVTCDLADSLTQPHVQGVCPNGWRLPTYSDWLTLLKKDGLKAPDLDVKYYGFQRTDGSFNRFGLSACFTCSTESNADWAYHFSFSPDMYDSTGVPYYDVKTGACSIRCVRDI